MQQQKSIFIHLFTILFHYFSGKAYELWKSQDNDNSSQNNNDNTIMATDREKMMRIVSRRGRMNNRWKSFPNVIIDILFSWFFAGVGHVCVFLSNLLFEKLSIDAVPDIHYESENISIRVNNRKNDPHKVVL